MTSSAKKLRDTTGRLPRSIKALEKATGQALNDPFRGRKLRLKTDKNGLIIYSVGPDGIADGGKPMAPYDYTGKGNIF